MLDQLPDSVTAKVHFITHYPELIKRNGPARNYWCQRFEGKHLYFKKLALRSMNFKNISFTLAKNINFVFLYYCPPKISIILSINHYQ